MASTPSAAPFFARLAPDRFSTGTKMLFILTVALLPLGLIALFASIQSAHSNQARREGEARQIATAEARQIDILLLRGAGILRANLTGPEPDDRTCRTLVERDQAAFGAPINLALFHADGTLACATRDFPTRSPTRSALPSCRHRILPPTRTSRPRGSGATATRRSPTS